MSIVLSGAVIGQAIAGLALLVLARLVTPTAFGVSATVITAGTILAIVLSGRLEMAIPTEADDSMAQAVVGSAMRMVVGMSVLVGLCLEGLARAVPGSMESPLVANRWLLVGVGASTAAVTVFSQMAVRRLQYRAVARRSVDQQLVTAVAQVGLSWRGMGATGLLIGVILGRATAAGLLSHRLALRWTPRFSPRALVGTVRDHWRFPLLFMPSALLNTLSLAIPIFVVGWAFDLGTAGQLGMAQRLMAIPAGLVTAAAYQVVFGEMSDHIRGGGREARRYLVRAVGVLSPIAALVMAAFFVLGPMMVPLLLGSQWEVAGEMCRWMGLGVGLGVLAGPLQSALTAFRWPWTNLAIDGLRVIAVSGAGMAMVWHGAGPVLVVAAMYAALGVAYLVTVATAFRAASIEDRRPTGDR